MNVPTLLFRSTLTALAALAPLAVVQATPLADDPYWLAPGFLGGAPIREDFGFPTKDTLARKAVRMDDGTTVIAGLGHPPTINQANAYWNLVMTKVTDGGAAYNWLSTAHTPAAPNQLVYPNSAVARYIDVRAMASRGEHILVQVDAHDPALGPYSTIQVFNRPGQHVGSHASPPALRDQRGAGLAVWESNGVTRVFAVSTGLSADNSRWIPRWKRLILAGDGQLTLEAQGEVNHPNCTTSTSCEVFDLAATRPSILDPGPPRIYLAITWRNLANANHQFMAMRVDTNGVPVSEFGGGTAVIGFDEPGSDLGDFATGIAVRTRTSGGIEDDILLSGRVSRSCRTATGVVRLRDNGQLETAFGNGGRLLFGGSSASPQLCQGLNPRHDYATGSAVSGQRLAIAGYAACVDCASDGLFAIVDIDAGGDALREYRRLTYPLVGGTPIPSVLTGITPALSGSFYVAGHTRTPESAIDPQVRNKLQFQIMRLAPDRLFGDGLE